MPQMMPMNWLFLYMLFTMIFILFNFMNYYKFMIKNKKYSLNETTKKKLNWKW